MTSSVKEEEEKEKEYDGESQRQHINRRQMTLSALVSTTLAFVSTTVSTESAFAAVTKSSLTDEEVYDLQSVAADAYNRQDFTKAKEALTKLIENEPESASWLEGRARRRRKRINLKKRLVITRDV